MKIVRGFLDSNEKLTNVIFDSEEDVPEGWSYSVETAGKITYVNARDRAMRKHNTGARAIHSYDSGVEYSHARGSDGGKLRFKTGDPRSQKREIKNALEKEATDRGDRVPLKWDVV